MDFVVIGLGLSALALLTGLTLLCLVAPRWFRKAGVAHPGDAAYARAQAGERHALGQGFLCVGAVLLLATLGGISAGLADKAGAYLIASITTIAVLGLVGWDLLYRRQHPIPRRRRAGPARSAQTPGAQISPLPDGAPPPDSMTARRRRVLPARKHPSPAAPVAAPAMLVDAASTTTAVDDQRPTDAQPPADAPETLPSPAATPVAEDSTADDGPQAHEPADATGATEDAPAEETPACDEPPQEEPAVAAALLPEPAPLELQPARAQEGAGVTASPDAGSEPDIVSNGDDRVIALFPTASARRGRAVAIPPEPDGQG